MEFSFLLAVPTMLAATGYDLFKNASSFEPQQFGVLAVGFVSSFLVALLSIKFLLAYVRTNTFIPFGIYRILPSLSPSPFCEGQRPQPFDRGRGRFGPNWVLGRELELGVGARVAPSIGMGCGSTFSPAGHPEFPQQALHIFAEAVMLDLESVPGRIFPPDTVADIGMRARFQRPEPIRTLRIGLLSLDEGRDQARLIIGDLPHATLGRLEQSHHEEIVELAVEGMDEKLRAALLVEDVGGSMKGKLGLKPVAQTRRSISSSLPSVKTDTLAVEPLDAGLHDMRPWMM